MMIVGAGPAVKAGMIAARAVRDLAKGQGPAGLPLNISGIRVLETALLGVVVLSLGITAAARGHAGKFAKVLEMLAVVVIAALVVGLSSGANFARVGTELFSTVFG
jgi:hypothetical protein